MKKEKELKKQLPKGFTIDPSLNGKYADEPYFKKKLERANEILRKSPPPKF